MWILKIYVIWFIEGIYIIEGNHDDRVARVTHGQLHLGMLIASQKIHFSQYKFMRLKTCWGLVWIPHPDNFSGDPVTLGQQLYNV